VRRNPAKIKCVSPVERAVDGGSRRQFATTPKSHFDGELPDPRRRVVMPSQDGKTQGPEMEVISCHDCHSSVSFSATRCPHCGSKEPSGPYQFSKKEIRNFRIEQRNDTYLIRTALLLGAIGLLYGIVIGRKSTGEGSWHAMQSAVVVVSALGYGLIGVLIGVPLAATINLYRSARHFLIPVVLVVLFLAYEFGFLRLH
jgi:hypothetical protein